MGGTAAIGDSIVLMQNTFDQQVYAVGMGPTETTIAIQDNVVPLGVPGTSNRHCNGYFSRNKRRKNNIKISERSRSSIRRMGEHEELYGICLHAKRAPNGHNWYPSKNPNIQPNGEYEWIGTTTTDAEGNFAYGFVPLMEGTYAVVATFDTNKGYWGSERMTYLYVGPKSTISVPPYPGYEGPSASEVAQNVVNSLPKSNPTPEQISQAVINSLPEYQEPTVTIPEYQTIDIVIVILVALAIVIGVVILFKKK